MASEPPPYISPSLTNLANMVNPSMSQSVQLKPGVFVRQIQATRGSCSCFLARAGLSGRIELLSW